MRPGLGGVWVWVSPDTILILQRTKWKCDAVLRGEPGHPWGRFGAALTVLGDVNGDRLADVAIGAPGEQENRGAVYLFHGTSELGISSSHSQVSVLMLRQVSLTCTQDTSRSLSRSSAAGMTPSQSTVEAERQRPMSPGPSETTYRQPELPLGPS